MSCCSSSRRSSLLHRRGMLSTAWIVTFCNSAMPNCCRVAPRLAVTRVLEAMDEDLTCVCVSGTMETWTATSSCFRIIIRCRSAEPVAMSSISGAELGTTWGAELLTTWGSGGKARRSSRTGLQAGRWTCTWNCGLHRFIAVGRDTWAMPRFPTCDVCGLTRVITACGTCGDCIIIDVSSVQISPSLCCPQPIPTTPTRAVLASVALA